MLKHPDVTNRRIERFLRNELRPILWSKQIPMQAYFSQLAGPWPKPVDTLNPPSEIGPPVDGYEPVEQGFMWGPIWSDAWFKLCGSIPVEWAGQAVCARIDCGAEAILWEGADPKQGIDGNHGEYLLTYAASGGENVALFVRANGMNPNVSCDGKPVDPPAKPFKYGHAFLAVVNKELIGLYHDFRIAMEVMREQPANEPRYGQLLYALNEVVNAWDQDDPSTIATCREIIKQVYNKPASQSAHEMSAIGHAHIDTAWLWPLERTQQKCLHTFATAARLMDLYPEYKFICSQAVQYEWIKQLSPALYDRIREKVKAGQWEIAGSMWVEADCNITGGESLVRQILLAKNFWMDEFGFETIDVWLPDVFGYAAALPQIMKKSGIKYFMTQKISWNQFNKFPHHTFNWQGIDGTKIFTHFPPADTYNAMVTPRELAFNVHNFKEHDRSNGSLYVFGFGDGGGGPTVEMLENARRLQDVEGMPKVKIEFSRDFFARMEAEAKDLPLWVGELYLELHRGTLTTQARNKRGNRKSEFLLRDAEFLASVDPSGLAAYPGKKLDRAWKLTLTNQFHDIIPGSSVNEVYVDSDRDYAEIEATGTKIVETTLANLGAQVDTRGMKSPVLVVRNYDDWVFGEPVVAPMPEGPEPQSVLYGDDAPAPVQIIEKDGEKRLLFEDMTTEEGHGYTVYDLSDRPTEEINTFIVTPVLLDNGLLRIEFDDYGLITRIWDNLRMREVLNPGEKANQLQLFEDKPLFWDAWDVDLFYQEKGKVLTELDSVDVVEEGPVRGAIRFVRSFGKSKLVQTVRLARDRNRIEFVTEVDWHEEHKMLKAAFPVAVNSPRATYEIQYGHVERPTHYNTSWDMARFEVAAQKWVDLSEGDYGVALLNDCKYGHDTFGNTLRLTLLRSPKAPDPEADMGRQVFTYAILPHYSDFRRGEVVENAYRLNAPPRAILLEPNQTGSLPREQAFFKVDREGVVIEAVKKAEKEDALIVRLYDAYNSRGPVNLKTSLPIRYAGICDLLERDETELPVDDGTVSFPIKPFEIVTLKLKL